MNNNCYIGIDASLTSTAISIKTPNRYHFFSYMKNYKPNNKWVKSLDFVDVKEASYRKNSDYSTNENYIIEDYSTVVSKMVKDIKSVITGGEIFVAIEGYSYSSVTSSIINLVTLGTLIRKEIKENISNTLTVYSPSTLKKETCGLVYGWTKKGKKVIKYETRNNWLVAGGNFKKHQMFQSVNESKYDSKLDKFCKEYYEDIYFMKKIPSPIDDLVDSYWLMRILYNDLVDKYFTINE